MNVTAIKLFKHFVSHNSKLQISLCLRRMSLICKKEKYLRNSNIFWKKNSMPSSFVLKPALYTDTTEEISTIHILVQLKLYYMKTNWIPSCIAKFDQLYEKYGEHIPYTPRFLWSVTEYPIDLPGGSQIKYWKQPWPEKKPQKIRVFFVNCVRPVTLLFVACTNGWCLCQMPFSCMKTKLPPRKLFIIMHKFRCTYPISTWLTTSWIFSL